MAGYDLFASYYDAVAGGYAPEATFIGSLIKQANPRAATVLELACGTGGIMGALASTYHVSGLDISPRMLAVARGKLPAETPLYHADMTCFALPAKFDAVICIYHSLNHLLDFSAWDKVFDRVRAHLNDAGVFIFDVNTISNLKMLSRCHKEVQEFGGNYLITRVRTVDEVVYDWDIEVFERQQTGRYKLLRDSIRTASFPVAQIRAALRRRFTGVRTLDDTDRVWFVCATR